MSEKFLKLNDVNFGLSSYGAGNGTAIFVVDIGETETESEALTYEQFKAAMAGDFPPWFNKIKADRTRQYDEVLSGSQKYHVYFKGGAVEKAEHAKAFAEFLQQFSRDSIAKQNLARPDQLRPPFIVWFGAPRHITMNWNGQMNTFYENFNFVMADYTEKTPDLPLREICNHAFHCLIVRATTVDDLDFLNGKQIRPNEISIIDQNDEQNKQLQLACALNGFRYFPRQTSEVYVLK